MKFLAAFTSLVAVASATPWDTGLWNSLFYVGGDSGTPFSNIAESGALVQKLRIYKATGTNNWIRGIKVYYTDGA